MSFNIGLRFYQITIHQRQNPKPLAFQSDQAERDPYPFLERFLNENHTFKDEEEAQRSWSIEPETSSHSRELWGITRYGTYGFASNLIDRNTRVANYKRTTDDLEEIPLFYHFWVPDSGNFGLSAFQSFQGRSCITLVTTAICRSFEAQHPNFRMSFRKISPDFITRSGHYSAPVKRLTFVSKRIPRDRADLVAHGVHLSECNYEVSIVAKRKGLLGSLSDVKEAFFSMPSEKDGVIQFEGRDYDQAKAEIVISGKRRTIGIVGLSSDTGAVDVTQDVKIFNGHPTFDSISKESDELMSDIYDRLS